MVLKPLNIHTKTVLDQNAKHKIVEENKEE